MHRSNFWLSRELLGLQLRKRTKEYKNCNPSPPSPFAPTLQGSHPLSPKLAFVMLLMVFELIPFNGAKKLLRDIWTYSKQLLLTQRKSGFSYCEQTCTQLQGPTFFCFAYKHQQQILFLTIILSTFGCISCIRDDCPGLKNS